MCMFFCVLIYYNEHKLLDINIFSASTDILFFYNIWLFHNLFSWSAINKVLVISRYFCCYKQGFLQHPCTLNICLLMEYP